MSSVIWLYIWILVKMYLEVGLFIALIFWILSIILDFEEEFTWKDFCITIFFYPIIMYYFIKELRNGR
jgi:hypothetical protein